MTHGLGVPVPVEQTPHPTTSPPAPHAGPYWDNYTVAIDTTPISFLATSTTTTSSVPLSAEQMRILGIALPGPLDALIAAAHDLAAACREYTKAWQ